MTASKPKQGKQKVRRKKPVNAKGKTSRNASHNWPLIKRKWYESGDIALDAFIRAEKLPRSSARRYLSAGDKNKYLEERVDAADRFRKRLAEAAGKDDSRLFFASLKQVMAASSEVMIDSAEAFKSAPGLMSKRDAGRLTLTAGEMMIKVAADLQGIPDEDELDGWPLTRLFKPFRAQRDFIHDTPLQVRLEEGLPEDGSQDPFVFALIGGRGAGKTYCGAQKAGQLAWLNRGQNGLILAPTYPMLRDAAKAAFLKACSDKGLSFTHLKTENAVILFGDTKVFFRSMDDPDKVRGLNVAWAWPDEPGQLIDREAFDIINGCIRGDGLKEPAIVITTTPKGLGWLYDVLVSESEANRVRLYRARTSDNPTLGDFEARLRSSYDPKFAAQELDAEFIDIFSGKAYWNYSSVDNVFETGKVKLEDALPIDLCCDFNVSPMAWNVSQDHTQNGHTFTYVLDEIHIDTASTELAAKEFVSRYGLTKAALRAGVRVWGDATGQHKGTSASRSDYEIIEQVLKAADIPVDIRIGRSNPRQRDRVLAVNARLGDANGIRKFFIASKCKHTRIDFERTKFKPGTQQLDKDQTVQGKGKKKTTLTHHTDALGYKVFNQWPVRGMQTAQQ